MRTTVDLDDDVLFAVKERARRERRSAGAVLSELARKALTHGADPELKSEFFGFAPLPSRGDAVSNTLIDQLRAEDGD